MKEIDIRQGDKFVCIKKVVMRGTHKIEFKKGYIYTSHKDNCITNESGEFEHYWNTKKNSKHFVKLK